MSTYTLVREAREGRQYEGEVVHCINDSEDDTVCAKYGYEEVRTVKNISVFISGGNLCEECSKKLSELL